MQTTSRTDSPALTVSKLHKRFGQLEVLKGISFDARDGDVISIIGSSGSGKSDQNGWASNHDYTAMTCLIG